jgi:hypothetical protein
LSGHDLGGAAQVGQHQVFVGALGVRFEHRARPGAVDRGRHAGFTVQADVGIERAARGGDQLTEHRFTVFLQRFDERLVAGHRLQRVREQQALDLDRDAGAACRRLRDHAADRRFHFHRVLFRDHAAVEPQRDLAGHDVGVGAAFDAADVEVRVGDAGDLRGDLLVQRVLVVQRVQYRDRALQGIDAGVGNRGMGHLSMHRHFHLQAAVVRGDDLVAEAGSEQQVGLRQLVLQQPSRAELTTEFFVVGEVQFDGALELRIQ